MYQFDGVMVSLNLGIDTNRQEVLGEKPSSWVLVENPDKYSPNFKLHLSRDHVPISLFWPNKLNHNLTALFV